MNVVDESNEKYNFPHKLLLTNTQFSNFRRAFANGSLANIKNIKIQKLNLKYDNQEDF